MFTFCLKTVFKCSNLCLQQGSMIDTFVWQDGHSKGQARVHQGELDFPTASESPGLSDAQGSVLVGTKLREAA